MDPNLLAYILVAVGLLGVAVWNLWVSVWVVPDAEKRVAALRDSPREIREAFLHHTIIQSRLARANHLTLILILLLLVVLALK